MSSMRFVFFPATAHWVDIFIQLSTITSRSPYRLVTARSDPISIYVKLDFFFFFAQVWISSQLHLMSIPQAGEILLELIATHFSFNHPKLFWCHLQTWSPYFPLLTPGHLWRSWKAPAPKQIPEGLCCSHPSIARAPLICLFSVNFQPIKGLVILSHDSEGSHPHPYFIPCGE